MKYTSQNNNTSADGTLPKSRMLFKTCCSKAYAFIRHCVLVLFAFGGFKYKVQEKILRNKLKVGAFDEINIYCQDIPYDSSKEFYEEKVDIIFGERLEKKSKQQIVTAIYLFATGNKVCELEIERLRKRFSELLKLPIPQMGLVP